MTAYLTDCVVRLNMAVDSAVRSDRPVPEKLAELGRRAAALLAALEADEALRRAPVWARQSLRGYACVVSHYVTSAQTYTAPYLPVALAGTPAAQNLAENLRPQVMALREMAGSIIKWQAEMAQTQEPEPAVWWDL